METQVPVSESSHNSASTLNLPVTRAEVNLDALGHNIATFRRLAGQATLIAVVKANGYGHGAVMIARAALANGVERLAVYNVEEGVSLRSQGIEVPILVFGPFQSWETGQIWEARLTPTVLNIGAAAALDQEARGKLPFHLKIDTGLTRSGIHPSDALDFMNQLRRFSSLEPEGIYTHFARSDEPDGDSITERQFREFEDVVRRLGQAGWNFPLKHVASTAAASLTEMQLDALRIGIGLYGYQASPASQPTLPLQPILTLRSTLARVQKVAEGAGVGYGHEFVSERESIIGLVPIGYGDGLPRSLGNGRGQVIVRGRRVPIVGRVSMDQITIDLTEVPEARAADQVTVMGSDGREFQSADDVASQAGTISYEILTSLLPRIPRFYFSNGEMVGAMTFSSGPRVIEK